MSDWETLERRGLSAITLHSRVTLRTSPSMSRVSVHNAVQLVQLAPFSARRSSGHCALLMQHNVH